MSKLIVVAGGIGSGKSVVCQALEKMGYEVYNCDVRAKQLMDASGEIKRRIALEISPEAVTDGKISRQCLAAIVFSDKDKLLRLNSIVHGTVREDISQWQKSHEEEKAVFVETAIPYESGLDLMANEIWEVRVSEEIRVSRIISRDGCTPIEAHARIESQIYKGRRHPREYIILNDGFTPILPQLHCRLNNL